MRVSYTPVHCVVIYCMYLVFIIILIFLSIQGYVWLVNVFKQCFREKDRLKQREEKWNHIVKLAQANPVVYH